MEKERRTRKAKNTRTRKKTKKRYKKERGEDAYQRVVAVVVVGGCRNV